MLTSIVLFTILYFVSIQSLKQRLDIAESKIKKLEGGLSTSTASVASPAPTPIQSLPLSTPKPVSISPDIHSENFGSSLAKVGIVILVLGIGFFLNYINSRGLLSYNVKFIIGLLAGGTMIGLAEYLKAKTKKYAEIVRGGGFVVWFLSVFIGSMIYGLFSTSVAFALVLAIVVVSFLISLRDKEETTFFIGVLGGYLVPVISGLYNDDVNTVVQVLLYICVLNIGIIIASRARDWMKTMTVGFIFSWLTLLSFYGTVETLGWQTTWFFTTIVGLTYLIVFIQGDVQRSRESANMTPSIILSVLNTGIYTAIAYSILVDTYIEPYLGFLIAFLGLIHLGVYGYIRKVTGMSDHPSALMHIVTFVILITAAVPVQFDGAIVTMIWFIEGVVISYLATLRDFRGNIIMYMLGLIGIIGGIMHMAMFGNYTTVEKYGIIFLNQNYLVWIFALALTQGIAYIWKLSVQEEGVVPVFKEGILSAVMFFVVFGQICFSTLTVREINGLKSYMSTKTSIAIDTQINDFRSYYGSGDYSPEQTKAVDELHDKSRESRKTLNRNFSLFYIIFFTIMTVIYLLIGLIQNKKTIRTLGVITLVITIIQLFSLAWDLGPLFRIGAFVGLGIVILLLGYAYTRYYKKSVTTALVLLMSFAIATGTHAAVVNPTEWSSMSTFSTNEINADGWYVVPLSTDVLSKSQKSDYGDIRIVNSANQEIPYVIVKQGVVAKTEAPIQNTNVQTKIIENTIQQNQGIGERVVVLDTGKEGQVYTGIQLERVKTVRNFRKVARVYISDTLLGATSPAWREVEQRDVVYNYTDPTGFVVEDMDIRFPNMTSRYIKIRFTNDPAIKDAGVEFVNQIAISGARMMYEERDVTVGNKIENYLSGNFAFAGNTPSSGFSVVSLKAEKIIENTDKKSTEVYVRDVQDITSIKLTIDKDVVNFNRDVTVQGSIDNITWTTVTSGQIYRIDSPIYKGEMLTIQTPVITYPYLRIIIQNKNDRSLKFENTVDVTIQRVGALFTAFVADLDALKLLVGNPVAVTPKYEIEKTLTYFNSIVPTMVKLYPVAKNPLFELEDVHTPFGEKYKNLVNIALIMFVALLGYLGYIWTRKA